MLVTVPRFRPDRTQGKRKLGHVRRAALLLVVVTAATAGCGSGPGYAQKMHDALAPTGSQLLKLRLELARVQSTQEAVKVLARLRRTERSARSKVAAITPPAKAAPAQHRFVAALDRLDRQVQHLTAVARKGKLGPFSSAAATFAQSRVFVQLGSALDAIQAAGYKLHLSS